MRLQPAHVEGEGDEYEGDDGQNNAHGKQFYRAITVFPVTEYAEQARAKTEYDQSEQNPDNDFDNEHDNDDG